MLRAAERMKVLQAGSLHAYLAYVLVLAESLLLIWLGGGERDPDALLERSALAVLQAAVHARRWRRC